jgi:hypothetical protein
VADGLRQRFDGEIARNGERNSSFRGIAGFIGDEPGIQLLLDRAGIKTGFRIAAVPRPE